MMNNQSFLVTGAAGFVGGNVVRELLQHKRTVRALVRRPEQRDTLEKQGVEVVLGDLRDPEVLRKAVEGVQGIYHIAALFREANQPDSAYHAVNVEAVRSLLDAAQQAGVRRLVHCSTVGVLGHIEHPPANEDTPYQPGDIYQETKMLGEQVVLDAFRQGIIRGVVIRPAMIYGPGDTRTLKMFKLIARQRFFYVGKGQNLVHFVDVRDLARAFRLAMEHTECNGQVYIVAGEKAMPLRELAETCARLLGVSPPWLRLPVKPMQWLGTACEAVCIPFGISPPIYRRRVDFYTKDRSFDGTRAEQELGYRPLKSPQDEWRDILDDYRERGWL